MTQTKYRPHQTALERVAGNLKGLPKFFLLRLPFQTVMSQGLILLSYTGRKSSKPHWQPVNYVQQSDTLLALAAGTRLSRTKRIFL